MQSRGEEIASNHLLEGIDYLDKYNYLKAKDYFNLVLHECPTSSDAYYHLGITYVYLKDVDTAIENFSMAINLKPDYERAYVWRGKLYCEKSKFIEAKSDCERALELNPSQIAAYYNLGQSYYALEELERALDCFNQVIKLDSENVLPYLAKAEIYERLNNLAECIANYESILELKPYCRSTILSLLRIKKMYELEQLNRKIETEPTAEAYYNRGLIYAKEFKTHQLGLSDFQKAIELHPDYFEAYLTRATYLSDALYNDYNRKQAVANSIDDYNAAIALNPTNGQCYYRLGLVYFNMKNYANAVESLTKAIQFEYSVNSAYNLRGTIKIRMNNTVSSIYDYLKSSVINDEVETFIFKMNKKVLISSIVNHPTDEEKYFILAQLRDESSIFRLQFTKQLSADEINEIFQMLAKIEVRRAARYISLGQRGSSSLFTKIPDEVGVLMASYVASTSDLDESEANQIAYDHLCSPLVKRVKP